MKLQLAARFTTRRVSSLRIGAILTKVDEVKIRGREKMESHDIPVTDSLSLTKAGAIKGAPIPLPPSLSLSLFPGPSGCFSSSPVPEISVALVNLTLRDIIPFRRGSQNNRHSTARRLTVCCNAVLLLHLLHLSFTDTLTMTSTVSVASRRL